MKFFTLFFLTIFIATSTYAVNEDKKYNTEKRDGDSPFVNRFIFSSGLGIPGTSLWITPTIPGGWFGRNKISPFDFNNEDNIPYYTKMSYSFLKHLELGICYNYSYYTYKEAYYIVNVKSNALHFRVNAYRSFDNNTELYGGIGVGYRFGEYEIIYLGIPNYYASSYEKHNLDNPIALEFTLGYRVFLFKNVGIYGELGWARSIVQIGMSYKLEN